jgi:hypothetical protein
MKAALAILWLACGIGAAGITNRMLQVDFPNQDHRRHMQDLSFSLAWGIFFGPVALGISLAVSGFAFDGWSLTTGEPS